MQTTSPPAKSTRGDPYCGQCGYSLVGLEDSARCPECGRPLVEVLMRPEFNQGWGKRYRSKATLFGLPVIDVAIGPHGRERRGKARGIIAVGDIATGWLAVGGICFGIVSVGGVGIGVFSLAGTSVGVLTAAGGLAISGGLAAGGAAFGTLANGGGAIGYLAQGGGAAGRWVRDGRSMRSGGPPIFDEYSWFFGTFPPTVLSSLRPMLLIVLITMLAASLIGMIAGWRLRRGD